MIYNHKLFINNQEIEAVHLQASLESDFSGNQTLMVNTKMTEDTLVEIAKLLSEKAAREVAEHVKKMKKKYGVLGLMDDNN